MKKRITQGRLSFNYNIYKHNFIHAIFWNRIFVQNVFGDKINQSKTNEIFIHRKL